MRYEKTVVLKNGKSCILRSGRGDDAKAVCDIFRKTHQETDFLLFYPEEGSMTEESERQFLEEKEQSDRAVEICAFLDGHLAGQQSGGFPLRKRRLPGVWPESQRIPLPGFRLAGACPYAAGIGLRAERDSGQHLLKQAQLPAVFLGKLLHIGEDFSYIVKNAPLFALFV